MKFSSRPRQAYSLPALLVCIFLLVCISLPALAQQQASAESASQGASQAQQTGAESTPSSPAPSSQDQEPPGGKRVFGVLPNYRTADISQEGIPISARQKFIIASKDSFDYPLVLLAGAFVGVGQLADQQPSFGQGLKGYAHRLVTNYADQAMG